MCWVLFCSVWKPRHKAVPCNSFSPLSSSERVLTTCLSLRLSGHRLHTFVLQSAVNLNSDVRSSGVSDAVCSFGRKVVRKASGLRGVNQSALQKERCGVAQCRNPVEPARAGETDLGRGEGGWQGCSNPLPLLNPQHGTKPLLANRDWGVAAISQIIALKFSCNKKLGTCTGALS